MAPDRIFYDGHCGLCHLAVRFLLLRDHRGDAFRFAPLQGVTFEQTVPPDARRDLPDSLVLQTPDGRLVSKSTAVFTALCRLGGGWGVLGAVGLAIPRALRDLGYDAIAGVRRRLFGRPADRCPVVPAELRERFEP